VTHSLFSSRRAVLRDPLCDGAFAPHAALGQLARWLRKSPGFRDLVGALAADAEQVAYLRGAHEFHEGSMTVALDSVKRGWLNALDTVKRRNQ
jgi:hypothetical protein